MKSNNFTLNLSENIHINIYTFPKKTFKKWKKKNIFFLIQKEIV